MERLLESLLVEKYKHKNLRRKMIEVVWLFLLAEHNKMGAGKCLILPLILRSHFST